MVKHKQKRQQIIRLSAGITLASLGLFRVALPVLAQVTAGATISNTATATYENPNDPPGTPPLNATSNTVTVTVSEVAGLTITDDATTIGTDSNSDGIITPNDVIFYDFLVTNTGNDTTTLFIPDKGNVTITGPGAIAAADEVQIVGTVIGGTRTDITPINVPTGGQTGSNGIGAIPGLTDATTAGTGAALRAGDSIIVRIPVTVNALAPSGAVIQARLGNTDPNDNTDNTQNQPDNADTPLVNEVRTIDDDTATGDTAGPPGNGEREASRFQEVTVGSVVQAFATLRKTNGGVDNNSTPNDLTDDIITYNLQLDVEDTPPAGSTGFTPGDLGPSSNIRIDGVDRDVILISDAIPENTSLRFGGTLTTPGSEWIVVYSNTDPTAANATDTAASWTTTAPTDQTQANAIQRIGFVYDGDGDGNLATTTGTTAANNNTIAAGESFTGFSFQVVTSGIPTAGGNIANIAQVFGTTDPDGDDDPTGEDPANNGEVYDESGDSDPSNFNSDGTPNPADDPSTPEREDVDNGVANPTNNGVDSGNNNTGTGTDGEDNVVTLALPGTILNGPDGLPGAVGPNDNTDDFTNRSAGVSAADSAPGSTPNPAPVTFTNTVNNPGTTPLTNVLIVPDTFEPTATDTGGDNFFDTIAAAALGGPGNPGVGGGTAIVPVGTVVRLEFGGDTAEYTLVDNAVDPGNPTPGDPTDDNFVFTGGPGSSPIVIPTLAAGESVDYTVTVDLPATALSTDPTGGNNGVGFDIPIYAFTDTNNDGRPTTDVVGVLEGTANRTIDRVYNGYLRLVKEQRLLQSNGTAFTGADAALSAFTDGAIPTAAIQTDRIIEYRITYANISVAPTGTGNVVLNANNIVILEQGTDNDVNLTITPSNTANNWAEDSAGGDGTGANGSIVTSHVIGGANAFLGTIAYNPSGEQEGTTQTTDVTEYINTVGVPITPGQSGTFTFQRSIN